MKNPATAHNGNGVLLYSATLGRFPCLWDQEHNQAIKRRLIDALVNSVYVFVDHIIIAYNYKDGTKKISIDDLPEDMKRAVRMNRLLAPQVGLEPTTLRLTAECSAIELLRKIESGGDLVSRAVSSQVPSALKGLTSVFGMGTGGTPSP